MTQQREAFEAWVHEYGNYPRRPELKTSDGAYHYLHTESEWRAWQAAQLATARGQGPFKLLRDCFSLLESFDYENDEDSPSKAFFEAHINTDWFFHVKNSIERQLNTESKNETAN